jgi:hypothetical protein
MRFYFVLLLKTRKETFKARLAVLEKVAPNGIGRSKLRKLILDATNEKEKCGKTKIFALKVNI